MVFLKMLGNAEIYQMQQHLMEKDEQLQYFRSMPPPWNLTSEMQAYQAAAYLSSTSTGSEGHTAHHSW